MVKVQISNMSHRSFKLPNTASYLSVLSIIWADVLTMVIALMSRGAYYGLVALAQQQFESLGVL